MSTMVSSVYPFTEKIHKEFQSSIFGRDDADYGYSLNAGMQAGGIEKHPLYNSPSLGGVWASQRPTNVPRRNSTSSVSSIAATRNRMNMNALTTVSNVIPETSATLSSTASVLNSVAEERFRGRAYSEGASTLSTESQLQQQPPIASSRYKTELCRPYEENGKCKYGDKCQFAHGKQELRQLIRHPKYKTELCRTFHTSGFCPYGPRCHFIHNQEDSINRGCSTMQHVSSNNIHQQQATHSTAYSNGMLAQSGGPIPVPTPHISERNHYNHRPTGLNILTKQISAGPSFGCLSYSPVSQSPPNGSPTFYQGGIGCSALMSPTSPNSRTNGSMFNFNNLQSVDRVSLTQNSLSTMISGMPPYDAQQSPPPLSNFDMFQSQGTLIETNAGDDSAFDGPPTPPDSDRESMTGSPPAKQRLPIFRCLSQSE